MDTGLVVPCQFNAWPYFFRWHVGTPVATVLFFHGDVRSYRIPTHVFYNSARHFVACEHVARGRRNALGKVYWRPIKEVGSVRKCARYRSNALYDMQTCVFSGYLNDTWKELFASISHDLKTSSITRFAYGQKCWMKMKSFRGCDDPRFGRFWILVKGAIAKRQRNRIFYEILIEVIFLECSQDMQVHRRIYRTKLTRCRWVRASCYLVNHWPVKTLPSATLVRAMLCSYTAKTATV